MSNNQETTKTLTAKEIEENWEREHDFGCNCERCYIVNCIRVKQKAIFEPLIKRVQELLKNER